METPILPKSYSEFLTKRGGINVLGEPNFILNFGSSPLVQLTIPDEFMDPYRDCWALCEWTAPEEFGDPDFWDERALGPYPRRGAYNPVIAFRDGKDAIMLDTAQLNLGVLEAYIWVILNHRHDSLSKRMQFLKDDAAEKKASEYRRLVDQIEDGAPAFLDTVSFNGQLNCNSSVKQKIDQLEKQWDKITDGARRFGRGGQVQAPSGASFQMPAMLQ